MYCFACKIQSCLICVSSGQAGGTALHLSAQNGHNQSARILLFAGCNPNVKNLVFYLFISCNIYPEGMMMKMKTTTQQRNDDDDEMIICVTTILRPRAKQI